MTPILENDEIERIKEALGKRPIVLVGLMGAGKSAVGRKIAARLQMPFVDADTEIEEAASMSVSEIFAHYGEEEFRRLEASVMKRLLVEGGTVLATGGGAYMNEATREAVHEHGLCVWLKADIELLMSRVMRRPTRPLLQQDNPRTVMESLIEKRYPVYGEAHIVVQSQDTTKENMAEEVIIAVRDFIDETQSKKSKSR